MMMMWKGSLPSANRGRAETLLKTATRDGSTPEEPEAFVAVSMTVLRRHKSSAIHWMLRRPLESRACASAAVVRR